MLQLPMPRQPVCNQMYTRTRTHTRVSQNKGNYLWNFAPNSGLRKFLCDGSIVEMCYPLSSRKTDAQSMINYAVVGQLSWQYLWAPTLDHCSLPQWSSSSVYSMIPSGGFISNSWHLSLCSMHSQLSVSPLNAIQLCLFQMCPTCIIPSTS